MILSILKAQQIDVNIKEVLEIEDTSIDYNTTITDGRPFKVNMELYNSGSVGYNARVRLDIFDKKRLIFNWF